MSPNFFIMYMERLSRDIEVEVNTKNWTLISITSKVPRISYLFFVDELTLLAKANPTNSYKIVNMLEIFSHLFGQTINTSKSKVIFFKNNFAESSALCSEILNIQPNDKF